MPVTQSSTGQLSVLAAKGIFLLVKMASSIGKMVRKWVVRMIDLGAHHLLRFHSWAPDRDLNPQYDGVADVDRFSASIEHLTELGRKPMALAVGQGPVGLAGPKWVCYYGNIPSTSVLRIPQGMGQASGLGRAARVKGPGSPVARTSGKVALPGKPTTGIHGVSVGVHHLEVLHS